MNRNAVICPPCGENVGLPTKEGQNRKKALWPLLPRLTAVLPPQWREMNGAFTLIELLVVVLIIGILAAVAVPQYKVAVEKSRVVSLLSVIKPIRDAEEIYYLNHGEYTDNVEALDVGTPAGITPLSVGSKTYNLPNGQKFSLDDANSKYRILYGGTEHVQIDAVLKNSSWTSLPAGNMYCGALPSDKIGLQVCKSFGSTQKANAVAVGCSWLASPPVNCEWYRIAL